MIEERHQRADQKSGSILCTSANPFSSFENNVREVRLQGRADLKTGKVLRKGLELSQKGNWSFEHTG